jgi:hypothetical protein
MNKRSLLVLAAAAALCGCGNQISGVGVGASHPNESGVLARHRARARVWMLPGASGQDLIYVADLGAVYHQGVDVYSYPQGKNVGFIQPDEDGFAGLCADKQGNVWVLTWATNGQAFYDKYGHGGTQPIQSIIASGVPSSCAVDRATGNLAIANFEDFDLSRSRGDIAIYKGGQGEPEDYYDDSITHYDYCAYDDKGNLFADGNTDFLNELARNGSTLLHIYLNKTISPASLQWNDGSLAVAVVGGGKGPIRIDRVTVKGSAAQIIGTTTLKTYHNEGEYLGLGFSIQAKVIAGPGPGSAGPEGELYFWPYPAGGKASKQITAPLYSNFYAVAFSPASEERAR